MSNQEDRTEDHGTWDDYYTLWDSWRTVFPFLQLTRPEMVAANINSFIKRYKRKWKNIRCLYSRKRIYLWTRWKRY